MQQRGEPTRSASSSRLLAKLTFPDICASDPEGQAVLTRVCHGGDESIKPKPQDRPRYREVTLARDHAGTERFPGSLSAITDCPSIVNQRQQGCTVVRFVQGHCQVPPCVSCAQCLADAWHQAYQDNGHQRRDCCPAEQRSGSASLACNIRCSLQRRRHAERSLCCHAARSGAQ